MFLNDSQIVDMTGIARPKRIVAGRAAALRTWLVEHGFVEDVDFFRRADGWYSVMHPMMRAPAQAPRPTVRRRA